MTDIGSPATAGGMNNEPNPDINNLYPALPRPPQSYFIHADPTAKSIMSSAATVDATSLQRSLYEHNDRLRQALTFARAHMSEMNMKDFVHGLADEMVSYICIITKHTSIKFV
jgi:hypothetical protein